MARHDSNTIIKFADVGLITDNDETAYRSETWLGGARKTTYPSM
jgi:hypothetical protein